MPPNVGFSEATGAGAPNGTRWATSAMVADDPDFIHLLSSNHHVVPQNGKLYLSFSYKGTFVPGTVAALINPALPTYGSWDAVPSSTNTWTGVNLDITSQATAAGDGTLEVGFGHYTGLTKATTFDVDNVKIYTCAAVSGDWTGDGTVDLMGTRTDGAMWLYNGKGTGTVGSGVLVSSGWLNYTWQGSPGDVNGDGYPDMFARRSDGTMWLYPGRSKGSFGSRTAAGSGWNAMTAFATPGDFDRDGRPDLVTRRSDGTLHLYRILANGVPSHLRQIGSGWNTMTSIIGVGDVNGDRRGDVVAVNKNGLMFSYLSSGTGFTGAKEVGHGWNGMNLLTSPGDLNKDGRGDLIARSSSGALYFYPGKTGGGVSTGRQIGSGWNGMKRIF